MKRITAGLAALMMFLTATPAVGQNVRPASINGPAAGEQSLQTTLNSIYGVGNVNAAADQKNWTAFQAVGNPALSLVIEQAGNASSNTFGLWGFGSSYCNIFSGLAGSGASATLTWLTQSSLTVSGGAGVNNGTCSGIDRQSFGFFLGGPGTSAGIDGRLFSSDSWNPAGAAHMLVYERNGLLSAHWEDVVKGDGDFNDFSVSMQGIQQSVVPEPSTYVLMASGLLGIGIIARRKKPVLAQTRA